MKNVNRIHGFLAAAAVIGVIAAGFFAAVLWGPAPVEANPAVVEQPVQTAAATTSVVYMRPGTATTSLQYPQGVSTFGTFPTYLATDVALNVQFTGSSTASVLNVAVQHSRNGVDWYTEALDWNANAYATSSPSLTTERVYTFNFSSTSIDRAATTATRTHRTFVIRPTLGYVRVLITMPIGSLNGALWAELTPVKEAL